MENIKILIESLLEEAANYGKISLALLKLKALDKTSEVISSLIFGFVVSAFMMSFLFFLSMGLAMWLGEIIGKTYYGFLIVAAFYAITGIVIYFFMRQSMKRFILNYFIKLILS